MKHVLFAAAALALVTGCDELDKNGRLGNGEFVYECSGLADVACNGSETILGFDLDRDIVPIAVGGRFRLDFDSHLTESGASEIAAVAPIAVETTGDDFVFSEAATIDFLARNDEDEVVDFVDFTALAADSLGIFSEGSPVSSVTLQGFDEVIVAVAPQREGQVLVGGFQYDWAASGPGLTLTQAPSSQTDTGGNVASLRSDGGSGTVTVTVTSGALQGSLTVVLGPGGGPTSTTAGGGSPGAGGQGGAGESGGAGGLGGGGFGSAGGGGLGGGGSGGGGQGGM